ncbi:MAG: universal stress protein [Chloroflexi bacterium]|nr:universal stress protein [Chloroflexota bacterium]
MAAGLREDGLEVETSVRRGDPATVIVALAEEFEANLILMTTRGRSGLGKLMLGSVADAVLANSQKPVLLLSEATNGVAVDHEENRLEAAYLATVIWNKEAQGLYTKERLSVSWNGWSCWA